MSVHRDFGKIGVIDLMVGVSPSVTGLSPQGDTVYQKVIPELDETDLQKTVQPMVKEYFEHGDTEEVLVRVGRRLGGWPGLMHGVQTVTAEVLFLSDRRLFCGS